MLELGNSGTVKLKRKTPFESDVACRLFVGSLYCTCTPASAAPYWSPMKPVIWTTSPGCASMLLRMKAYWQQLTADDVCVGGPLVVVVV